MDKIKIDIQDHVAVVSLNKPEKLNALDLEMMEQLISVAEELANNAVVRVVVLTGEGRAFCAGMDLANFMEGSEIDKVPLTERTHGTANLFQKPAMVWRELPVPVIAAGQGIVFGGGLQIFSGADIRYVTPDCKLSILEMKWGMIPDMAGTQLWRHTVRDDIIRELTYTHRIFSGEEAVQYGFATHLSETPLEAAMALAKEIASKSPSAIVKAKKVLNAAPYLDVAEGLQLESSEQADIIKKKNQMEAVYAGIQKRVGKFEDYR